MWSSKHTNAVHNLSTEMQMAAHADYSFFRGYSLLWYPDRNRHVSIHSSRHTVRLVLLFVYRLWVMSSRAKHPMVMDMELDMIHKFAHRYRFVDCPDLDCRRNAPKSYFRCWPCVLPVWLAQCYFVRSIHSANWKSANLNFVTDPYYFCPIFSHRHRRISFAFSVHRTP